MIVFQTIEQVEIFANLRGEITIKQDDAMGGDPALVSIPIAYVSAVIKAIRAAKKDAETE